MKKIHKTLFILFFFNFSLAFSQCINTVAYGSAVINSCSSGTISTCNYASEYSSLTFNTIGTYTFNSSVPTDYLTLTTTASVVIASGYAPLVTSIPIVGAYRLHVSTNAACGTQNVCRVTTYACGAVSTATGCISPTAYGTATINACASGTITTCNYGGEYSQLTLGTTGMFTFYSSNPTDFLTFTDAVNTILYSGTTPLAANITIAGNYRLHVSTSSLCGTDAICRTTSYSCLNVPCSGTPSGGTTTASSNTICGTQSVNFGLSGSTMALGLTYQWQSSPNNITWTSLPTYTNSTMSQVVSASTYYKCIVSCGSFSASSVSTLVTLGAIPTGGSAIVSSTTSCAGTLITFSLTGSSSWPGIGYQWQSSPNNVTWTNLVGYNASTMSQMVTTTTYYRCLIYCSTSSGASSSVLITSASALFYASIPYYDTFDNTWQNGCATRNVPNNTNWKSSPLTGDNAWRRQDDGVSASWASASSGTITPHSGTGCANFHSSTAPLNSKGDLDILVNMNQNGKYAISFYYLNPSGTDNLDVLVSNDAGISYSIKASYNAQPTWTKKTIYYVNSITTPSCIVRFKGTSDNGIDDLGIDSLSIKLVCINPTITATASNTSICVGQSVLLTGIGATNYTWSPVGITTSTASVSPTVNTNYILTGSNDGLCFPTAVISISVSACLIGIEEITNEKIEIFPNPTNGILNINFDNDFLNSTFELTNAIGEVILKQELNNKQNHINIETITTGIYFYKINKNGLNIKIGKVLKK
jgi:hypothetical protein